MCSIRYTYSLCTLHKCLRVLQIGLFKTSEGPCSFFGSVLFPDPAIFIECLFIYKKTYWNMAYSLDVFLVREVSSSNRRIVTSCCNWSTEHWLTVVPKTSLFILADQNFKCAYRCHRRRGELLRCQCCS